jgi:hypothetical protein
MGAGPRGQSPLKHSCQVHRITESFDDLLTQRLHPLGFQNNNIYGNRRCDMSPMLTSRNLTPLVALHSPPFISSGAPQNRIRQLIITTISSCRGSFLIALKEAAFQASPRRNGDLFLATRTERRCGQAPLHLTQSDFGSTVAPYSLAKSSVRRSSLDMMLLSFSHDSAVM